MVLTSHAGNILTDQYVSISGKFFDSNGGIKDIITIKYFDINSDSEKANMLKKTVLISHDGKFSDRSFIPSTPGTYLIEAKSNSNTYASINVNVVEFTQTWAFYIIIVGFIAFVTLLLGTALLNIMHSMPLYHMMRFSCITILVSTTIIFFIVSDIEYGTSSPIGISIIEKNLEQEIDDLNTSLKLNWVVHFGGHAENNYDAGLNIPIYVIIFGILGGYMRFFYFSAYPWLKNELVLELKKTDHNNDLIIHLKSMLPNKILTEKYDGEKVAKELDELLNNEYKNVEDRATDILDKAYGINSHDDSCENIDNSSIIFHPILKRLMINRVIKDLSLFIIAPVLAIMMYFLLLQGGLNDTSDVMTFIVTSFTTGLFTDSVIQKIHDMTQKEN